MECFYFISNKNPASCVIHVKNQKFRALLDTGADVSLLRNDIFERIKDRKSELEPSNIILRNASGKNINVLGQTELQFHLGSESLSQKFCVSDQLKTPIILGRDFLCTYNVYIKLGEHKLEINGKTIPLVHFDDVTSLVRLAETIQIPPQYVCTTYGKYHNSFDVTGEVDLLVNQVETGFLAEEPGLLVMNGMGKTNHKRQVPLVFVNTTNRHFTLNKGNVVAKVEPLGDAEVHEITSDQYESVIAELSVKKDEQTKSKEHQMIEELLDRNADIFAKHEYDIGQTNLMKAHIETGDAEPIRKKMFRTPFALRDEVRRQIKEMLKVKLISPSNSSWSAPIFCIKKKNGSVRIVCDYRAINDVTKKFYWPLPNIDDIFASLGGCRYISTLDFLKGYMQLPLDDQSKLKTAFVCEEGLFHFNVLSFGLCTAPSIFQECMSRLLNGLSDYATAYLDDLIIYSKSISDHCLHLQNVFDRIRKANLKLERSKCTFLRDEVPYLGHIITKNGIKPDDEKIKVIQKLERPQTVKGVRAFIGMTSYYRRYIPSYAKIAEPLTQLTRKHVTFEWNDKRQQSFEKLKAALINPPLLAIPQLNEQFHLYTDASDKAIGGCLTQTIKGEERPIYYLSHQLSKTQRTWSTIEKECFAIVFALEKFRVYLEGKDFPIFCDHNPLKYINSAQNKNAKLQRWATKISAFGGRVTYIKGCENKQADFLSRLEGSIPRYRDTNIIEDHCDVEAVEAHLSESDTDNSDDEVSEGSHLADLKSKAHILEKQSEDPKLNKIIQDLKQKGERSKFKSKYILMHDVLHYIDKDEDIFIEVPKCLQNEIIQNIHESCLQHLGRDKTFNMIRKRFHWKGMTRMISEYLDVCVPCNKRNLKKVQTPLQEIEPPRFSFQRIAIDTAGPYVETEQGNRYVITVVDCFSGFIEAFPVSDKTAVTVAKVLLNQIFRRYSWCEELISDNGREYANDIIAEIAKQGHIVHIKTSPYHPQSNGKVERSHRTLVSCLSKVSNKLDWDKYVAHFCGAHNFSAIAGTNYSPFYLLFHRDPTVPIDTIMGPRQKYYGEEFLPTA